MDFVTSDGGVCVLNDPGSSTKTSSQLIASSRQKTVPSIVLTAMERQQRRAEVRCKALQQVGQLVDAEGLIDESCGSKSLITSVRLLLLASCLGLSCLDVSDNEWDNEPETVFNYQDHVQAAKSGTQQKIQAAAQELYSHLIDILGQYTSQQAFDDAHSSLTLCAIAGLSTKHHLPDLNQLSSSGVLTHLELIMSGVAFKSPRLLRQAACRLLKALSLTGSCLADRLADATAQTFVNLHVVYVRSLHHAVLTHVKSQVPSVDMEQLHEALSSALMTMKRMAVAEEFKPLLCEIKWVNLLLDISLSPCHPAVVSSGMLKPRLLALQILEDVLQYGSGGVEQKQMVVEKLFMLLAGTVSNQIDPDTASVEWQVRVDDLFDSDDGMVPLAMKFEQSRSVRCTVSGNVITHKNSNEGYAVGSMALMKGLFRWKVMIEKEVAGDEATCVGVSKYPLQDFDYLTTRDMWLYRANDGFVYHAGGHKKSLESYGQGDTVTIEVNMAAKSISFAKNDGKLQLAGYFDADIFYPVVVFQSGSVEKRLSFGDILICQNATPILAVGDPLCAPPTSVLAQAAVELLRSLHGIVGWTEIVNEAILMGLKTAGELLSSEAGKWLESVMTTVPSSEREGHSARQMIRDGNESQSRKPSDQQYVISEDVVVQLCSKVWPALAVIGGVDEGLRVGARCLLTMEGKTGTVLGIVKGKRGHVHVQLDDAERTVM
jgi:E3 ubiquitin-protein ligase HERC1